MGGQSDNVAKLKLLGPDINCVIIGAGNTLSGNPHRYTLLAGILGTDPSVAAIVPYCQVSAAFSKATQKLLPSCFSEHAS